MKIRQIREEMKPQEEPFVPQPASPEERARAEADSNQVVMEICTGILLYAIVTMLLAFVFFRQLPVFSGLLTGAALAAASVKHMAVVTSHAMDLAVDGAGAAKNKVMIQSVVRKIAVFVIIIFTIRIPQINTLAAMAGFMGLKAGVFLQPWIHMVFEHRHS